MLGNAGRRPSSQRAGKRAAPRRRTRASAPVRVALASAAKQAAAGRDVGFAAVLCIVRAAGGRSRVIVAGKEKFLRWPRRSRASQGADPLHASAARALVKGLDWSRLAPAFFAIGAAQRLKIMAHLLEVAGTYRSLQRLTRLQAGPLYHHINRLRLAGLVKVEGRDRYVLTGAGRDLMLAVVAVAALPSGRA